MTPRHAPPSGRTFAHRCELGAPGWAWGGALVGAALTLSLLGGCATPDPIVESALRSYDLAVAHGLATERLVRPYARLNDGAPWSKRRVVEIAR